MVQAAKMLISSNFALDRSSLHTMRNIFTAQIFKGNLLAQKSLLGSSSPTTTSATTPKESLSVTVVFHLLKANIFQKASMDIQHWICDQIIGCRLPLHSLMPNLIKLFVEQTFETECFTCIPESTITSVYANTSSSEISVTQVLMLYYTLLYNDTAFVLNTETASSSQKKSVSSSSLSSKEKIAGE